MAARKSNDETRDEVIAGLDIMAEYEAMGVVFDRDEPRANGKISCYGFGRETPDENTPSGWVDTTTGQYGDSGSEDKKSLSIFDFAIQKAGKFADFKSALEYFAGRAGVKLTKQSKKKKDPYVELKFQEWDDGNKRLAEIWCAIHKPGTSLDAILRAGGRIARFRSFIDPKTGEHRDGKHKVIALPCYGEKLNAVPPVAWIAWDIGGAKIELFQGKSKPPKFVKMYSCGDTYGTLMNLETVAHLAAGLRTEELIWKTGGPTDMLAVMTVMPPELRSLHLVTANASGEGGDVPPWQAAFFSGRKLMAIHDADKAGRLGDTKWAVSTYQCTQETKVVRLPYSLREKHGLDLRDWLNGVEDGPETEITDAVTF